MISQYFSFYVLMELITWHQILLKKLGRIASCSHFQNQNLTISRNIYKYSAFFSCYNESSIAASIEGNPSEFLDHFYTSSSFPLSSFFMGQFSSGYSQSFLDTIPFLCPDVNFFKSITVYTHLHFILYFINLSDVASNLTETGE